MTEVKKLYKRKGHHRWEKPKDDFIKTARELGYPESVVEKLYKAKRVDDKVRIMVDARHGIYN